MSLNFNKTILGGRLTRDGETRTAGTGNKVWKSCIAVNGRKEGDVLFIEVKAFGKIAESLEMHVRKGTPVLFEGRIDLEQWEREGEKRSKHVLIVDFWQFSAPRADAGGGAGSGHGRLPDPEPSGADTPF